MRQLARRVTQHDDQELAKAGLKTTQYSVFNSLSAAIRGSGNMAVPAFVSVAGTVVLIPLSPLLIFGCGPLPGLGIAAGALALLLFYAVGSVVQAAYLWSGRSVLRPAWTGVPYRWVLFRDILRVGLMGAVSTVATGVRPGRAAGGHGRHLHWCRAA